MKNNNKGFTLVELLAVIVILAVIILIAVNAIIPQMNKARKNSFIDEVAVYAQAAEKAYVANQIDDTTLTCFTIGSGTTAANELNGEYVKKSSATYKGVVKLDAEGKLSSISLKNDKFAVQKSSTAKPTASNVKNLSDVTWVSAAGETSDEKCE